jgi:hypothetical protein
LPFAAVWLVALHLALATRTIAASALEKLLAMTEGEMKV